MEDLKLIALDPEDLQVLSCHLQDAVIRVGDMAYLKAEMRFAAIANRFDWERAALDDARTALVETAAELALRGRELAGAPR